MHKLFQTLVAMSVLAIALTLSSCQAAEQGSGATTDQASGRTSVSGMVFDHLGAAVPKAPIQAVDKTTGAVVARTLSSADGQYTLAVAPGTYTLSISMPCCVFKPFVKEGIKVEEKQNVQFNVRLEQDEYFDTVGVGDDPGVLAAAVRKQTPPSSARPVPKTSDGKPDLSGVWLVTDDPYPQDPLPLPQAAALAKQRTESLWKDHPHTRCLPWGMPAPFGVGPALAKFVQTPALLVILFEDPPGFRQVFLDGRNHPANIDPSWMGHSVGTWNGDVLIVDRVGFNDRAWMLSYPRTENLHVIERYRRPDFNHLEVQITIEDPGVFRTPWEMNMTWELAPQEEILEFVCENNKFAENTNEK